MRIGRLNVSFGWRKNAGLVTLWLDGSTWSVHFGVAREFWIFGHSEGWYDGPLHDYGLGPLILACKADV